MKKCKLCEQDIIGNRTIENDVGYHIECVNVVELHDKIKSLEAQNSTLRLENMLLKECIAERWDER